MITCQAAAVVESISALCDFAQDCLNTNGIDESVSSICMIIIDEIVNNIASYAYPGKAGNIRFGIDVQKNKQLIDLYFEDTGIPFDPISQKSPELNGSADDRPIGGLGIHMVKKLARKTNYSFTDGKNILTVSVPIT